VLVVERGQAATDARDVFNERAALIDKQPYDDRAIDVNSRSLQLYMGGVVGGGSAVFGGAMLRPSVDDFTPGRHYSDELPRDLSEWPLQYDDLAAWYDRAERLFSLASDSDDVFRPLQSPSVVAHNGVLPMAAINHRLIRRCRNRGLRPFRLPLAIDRDKCDRCDMCAGYLCPNEARKSAADLLTLPETGPSITLMANTEVQRLETDSAGNIAGVHILNRHTHEQQRLTAKCYALAAGAIGSPAILLKSGIDDGLIGRNYMMHYSPIAIGLFPRATEADHTFVKQVGFADFYFGTKRCPRKMGLVQSLPAPGPLLLAKSGLKRMPDRAVRFLRARMLPLAGIVEDLPHPANRVSLRDDGQICLDHSFSRFDRDRGRALGREMRRILLATGAVATIVKAFPSHEHVAHQCGTIRMGTNPRHASLDRDCRLFGRSNLFVVDGSVLPTSMGVGPSLTIVANSLRVASLALHC